MCRFQVCRPGAVLRRGSVSGDSECAGTFGPFAEGGFRMSRSQRLGPFDWNGRAALNLADAATAAELFEQMALFAVV